MAGPDDSHQALGKVASGIEDAQMLSFEEYLKERSASSNDCNWLHELVSANAVSTGKITPKYLVRVCYKDATDTSTTTEDFGTEPSALHALEDCLASKHIRAVILCHRDSSQVDPKIVDLLWARFKLEVSFMRHHFNHKGFRNELGCPKVIRNLLEEEECKAEDYWTLGGRWKPIRLPSETKESILRLSIDSECFSTCCRDDTSKSRFPQMSKSFVRITTETVIALVRSQAVYQIPWSSHDLWTTNQKRWLRCNADLFAATTDSFSIFHESHYDSFEFSCSIVHFYARLLILRCYEDYILRHDTQPIQLDFGDRLTKKGHPHILDMHCRRLELLKLKQDLSGYLGFLASEHKSVVACKGTDPVDGPYLQKLQGLLSDAEMLLSLYDNTMRIYDWRIQEVDSEYKGELASEQLEEAKESKATAISLGKLSNLAFLYLPMNFVCALLGMNLSIFGQGEVPVWMFLILVAFFGLLTYLPVYLPQVDERRIRLYKVAYQLTRRSIPAGLWFLAFSWTHSSLQNFEILHSGLAQAALGYTGHRTKGWRDDDFFERATLGSQAFWKEKVKEIFLKVGELNPNNGATELNV